MVKVSIIVPVYNSAKYLHACIDSILKQTYKDFELILINDGSTDSSLSILEDYSLKDKRIRVINQKNRGIAKTRNKGIDLAIGEYITFIDNDDTIQSDFLESFLSNCQESDVVIGGYRRVDTNYNVIFKYQPKQTFWAKYTFITPWARFFKREFLIKNGIEFLSSPIGEDIYFNLKIYSKTDNIKIINYAGYNWLYNIESVSNTVHKGFNEKVNIVKFMNDLYHIRDDKYKEYFDFYYYRFGIWYLLYSGRHASPDKYMTEYNKIQKWNKKNDIKMNIFPFSRKISGERFSVRFLILFFTIISKIGLMDLFSKIYCKQ